MESSISRCERKGLRAFFLLVPEHKPSSNYNNYIKFTVPKLRYQKKGKTYEYQKICKVSYS